MWTLAKGVSMNERMPAMFWVLTGGILGAGLTLLLAPQSGRDTRQLIVRKVRGAAGSARGLKDRVVSRSEEIWGEATQRVGEAASALSGAERTPGNGDAPSGLGSGI
jgi:gas vesicle protein